MTAFATPLTQSPAPGFASHAQAFAKKLYDSQPQLAAFGLGCLMFGAATAMAALADPRHIAGASVWLKPTKFFVSTGVLSLTSAFFFGLVRPERRRSRALRISVAVMIGCGVFELGYISLQGALGQTSHFNYSTLLHAAIFALMGVASIAMLATKLPLAIEIARRPAEGVDPAFRLAAVLGLSLTIALGLLSGMTMGALNSHAVGPETSGLPVFGWSRSGGDLRASHFLGMHAEQVVPAVAALAAAFGVRKRKPVVITAAAGIAAVSLFAFVQALAGKPFPFG